MEDGLNRRKIGMEQEERACQYLTERGVRIRERNFRCRQGEIDIIGCEKEYLVFFEVKYRRDDSRGNAAEAVGFRKQRKICRVADYYRYKHGIGDFSPIRYDVVTVDGIGANERIDWYKNAFYHIGR